MSECNSAKNRFIRIAGRTVAVLIWLAIMPTSGLGQQVPISQDDWPFGYQGFNLLIQETGLEICSLSHWLSTPVDQRAIIAIDHQKFSLKRFRSIPTFYSSRQIQHAGVTFKNSVGKVYTEVPGLFYEHQRCPIVIPVAEHPIFEGVDRIICNHPTYIQGIGRDFNPSVVLRYPPRKQGKLRQRFLAVNDQQKLIVAADQQLFSNQMLFKGDNLVFAENVLRWLTDDFRRKRVLLSIGGQIQTAIDQDELEVEAPIPTPDEVLDALQNLPQDKMVELASEVGQQLLEQANTLAAESEDKELLNKAIQKWSDSLREPVIHRFVLLVIFATCCLLGFASYFWQRKIRRKTSSNIQAKRLRTFGSVDRPSVDSERKAAATIILNAFCLDVANRRLADWADFPAPLDSGANMVSQQATHEMADAFWALKTKPNSYWNPDRLQNLAAATERWRRQLSSVSSSETSN